MRILHVIPAVADCYGGPSEVVLGMCKALNNKDQNSLICTTDANGNTKLDVEYNKVINYKGVPTIFFPLNFSESYKYSYSLQKWLNNNVFDFDIVHIHAIFSHSSIAAAVVSKKMNVPYIIRPLGSLNIWGLNKRSLLKSLMLKFRVNNILKHAKFIHYTSLGEKNMAEAIVNLNNGVVIPNGIKNLISDKSSTSSTKFQNLKNKDYILVLSRLHPVKRIEYIIEEFSTLLKNSKHTEWKLVIAGDGDISYIEKIKSLINSKNLTDNVLFTGWVDKEQKIELYSNAKLFICTSYQENFGLSIAEAMSFEVPVLVSKTVNISQEIESSGSGWVVNPDNERDVLCKILDDDKERNLRGNKAGEFVMENFTWDKVADQLVKLYKSALKNK